MKKRATARIFLRLGELFPRKFFNEITHPQVGGKAVEKIRFPGITMRWNGIRYPVPGPAHPKNKTRLRF